MAGMLAVFAEFEREILRERVRAGIAQARKEGRPARPAADGVAEGRRGPPAQGRAGEPLGDRPAAGDRPDLGAADPGRGLTTSRACSGRPGVKNGLHRTLTSNRQRRHQHRVGLPARRGDGVVPPGERPDLHRAVARPHGAYAAARRIPGNDKLNSVDCLLPKFDKETVERVVKALREGGGDTPPTGRILINSEGDDVQPGCTGNGVGEIRLATLSNLPAAWGETRHPPDGAGE